MKKLFILILLIFLIGCGKPKTNDPFDGIKNLKRYYSEVNLQLISNRKTSSYDLTIYYDENVGDTVRINEDRLYNFKDGSLVITDIQNDKNYEIKSDFDKIFHSIFCHKYINDYISEGKNLNELKKMEYNGKIFFELPIEKLEFNSYYYVNGKLLINCELLTPSLLLFTDKEGKETLKATYLNFYKS